jgi:hypothetical protein
MHWSQRRRWSGQNCEDPALAAELRVLPALLAAGQRRRPTLYGPRGDGVPRALDDRPPMNAHHRVDLIIGHRLQVGA